MSNNVDLKPFDIILEGETAELAKELRGLYSELQVALKPFEEERNKLMEQVKLLDNKIEEAHGQFDQARTAFFTALGENMGQDLTGASLEFTDQDQARLFRTEEITQIVRVLRVSPAPAHRCGDPECAHCATKH